MKFLGPLTTWRTGFTEPRVKIAAVSFLNYCLHNETGLQFFKSTVYMHGALCEMSVIS